MFSIIIPSFNRKSDLLECLNKLNNQTYNHFEVVVIDDFSDVPVSDYICSYDYDFSISVIRNNENKGPAISRNNGVRISKHNWIMFLDDDDFFFDNKCEILKTYIEGNDVKFFYHPAFINMLHEDISYKTKPVKSPSSITDSSMLMSNPIGGTPMWCISKELFLKLGGFNHSLKALEDYEFILRMLKNIKKSDLLYIDIPLTQCNYLTKRSSVSKNITNTKNALSYLQDHFYDGHSLIFKKYYNEHMAHSYLMSLSRISSLYYLRSALCSNDIISLIKAILVFISPSMSIKLRRYF
ncbi:glycosyltransferase family 2 protein [Vibrio cholerae]|uniref:glycosyltransferase family 2 protein n=1 Tax=Vibrio cholerae TaxID=666 RepID=UPI0011D3595B|nr:glycosyltransferase family 2 protein [Vibrio cholerae]EGQ8592734.1 glycosyltransferase [Vibrio cholerae]EGQ8662245.1 glycosyltransferase [Vibrio cholerae]EGR1126189.1 glycosyltransferase family 2 protein [Vibrio cholerae]EGR4133448.1 glycosyltransferase family 2 protein [Vibrio cholerae]EKG0042931.1 glycosyltransferase family 2 protein [Vibrio cholerae]